MRRRALLFAGPTWLAAGRAYGQPDGGASRAPPAAAGGAPARARPVWPRAQVTSQPGDQVAFAVDGREVMRYHHGPGLRKPYVFPIVGPAGVPVLRLGHPRDPSGHGHHLGLWLGHQRVADENFWEHRPDGPAIVHDRLLALDDGPKATLRATSRWLGADHEPRLLDERTLTVTPVDQTSGASGFGELLVDVTLRLSAPGKTPVTLGTSAYGPLGVRVARTMSERDGGGRLMNSEGRIGEPALMPHRRARWCDYSGPVAPNVINGVTLYDHPANEGHPCHFHVRADGWMGVAPTKERPLIVAAGAPLTLRYRLWVHARERSVDESDAHAPRD
jgi:hypothetical protein